MHATLYVTSSAEEWRACALVITQQGRQGYCFSSCIPPTTSLPTFLCCSTSSSSSTSSFSSSNQEHFTTLQTSALSLHSTHAPPLFTHSTVLESSLCSSSHIINNVTHFVALYHSCPYSSVVTILYLSCCVIVLFTAPPLSLGQALYHFLS